MRRWKPVMIIVASVLLVLAVAVVAMAFIGVFRWKAGTAALSGEMEGARVRTGVVENYDSREIEDLPPPVRRYFRAVLEDGQPFVAAVRVEHIGTFNMGGDGEKWKPFTSTQRVVVRRPGFIWDARVRMAPGMRVFVHDAYVAGHGVLEAKLFGLLTVMKEPRTPELARGELMRFFAEAAWYPTALLPSQGVRWEAIDDTCAGAVLTDGATTIRMTFEFDGQGLIRAVRSEDRSRVVGKAYVATPWQGRFWDYERRDGMLVPLEGEVAWILPDGPKPYWRGRIVRVEYEYAR